MYYLAQSYRLETKRMKRFRQFPRSLPKSKPLLCAAADVTHSFILSFIGFESQIRAALSRLRFFVWRDLSRCLTSKRPWKMERRPPFMTISCPRKCRRAVEQNSLSREIIVAVAAVFWAVVYYLFFLLVQ